jgi:hypothetical protein
MVPVTGIPAIEGVPTPAQALNPKAMKMNPIFR